MKAANNGPFYAAGLYPKLAELFRAHGYALAVHGSVGTDFDLIAVPWVDEAGAPEDVIMECLAKFAFDKIPGQMKPTAKPHDRCAFKLYLSFGDCALDISFTPRTGKWWKAKEEEKQMLELDSHLPGDKEICGIICNCGPNGEPLACGYSHGHAGNHSWATLPTFPLRNDELEMERKRGVTLYEAVDRVYVSFLMGLTATDGNGLLELLGAMDAYRQAFKEETYG